MCETHFLCIAVDVEILVSYQKLRSLRKSSNDITLCNIKLKVVGGEYNAENRISIDPIKSRGSLRIMTVNFGTLQLMLRVNLLYCIYNTVK